MSLSLYGYDHNEVYDTTIPPPIEIDFTKFATPRDCYDYLYSEHRRYFDIPNTKLLNLAYAATDADGCKEWRVGTLNISYFPDQSCVLGLKFPKNKQLVKVEASLKIKGTISNDYWAYSLVAACSTGARHLYPGAIVQALKEYHRSNPTIRNYLGANNGISSAHGYTNAIKIIERFRAGTDQIYNVTLTDPNYLPGSHGTDTCVGLINYHRQYEASRNHYQLIPYHISWKKLKFCFTLDQ